MHSPHTEEGDAREDNVQYLNINKQPTALVAGSLNAAKPSDLLIIGTADAPYLRTTSTPTATRSTTTCRTESTRCAARQLRLGNRGWRWWEAICSIQGFDEEGQERVLDLCLATTSLPLRPSPGPRCALW